MGGVIIAHPSNLGKFRAQVSKMIETKMMIMDAC